MWIKSREENCNENYCRGIIEKDNKILMVKEAKKKCYGKWNVPAGHLENGETIFEGLLEKYLKKLDVKLD